MIVEADAVTPEVFQGSPEGMLLDFLPLSRHLGARGCHRRMVAYGELGRRIIRTLGDEVDTAEESGNTIVRVLRELHRTDPLITERHYVGTLFDGFVVAGVTTTTSTMYALINILLTNTEVYVKLQAEISSVLGDRRVTLADREKLPYLMATINENFRFTSITPLLLPHCTCADTQLDGKPVPKDTLVFINAWSLHHNPAVFPEPWRFVPERFLDADGRPVLADHPARRNLYTFSAGPRSCFGEIVARSRLFLLTATLLQRFRFRAGTTHASPDPRDYNPGVPLSCKTYTVVADEM